MNLITISKYAATLAAVYVASRHSYFNFLLGAPFIFLGGGGGKAPDMPQFQAPPPVAPPPPTVDDAQVRADTEAAQKRRIGAMGLSATDQTQGALAADPSSLNTKKPTLLGGGTDTVQRL